MCPVEEIINSPGCEWMPAAEEVEGGLVVLGDPRLGVEGFTPCRNIAAASSQGGTGNLRSVQGWRKGALAFEEEQQTVCESWCAGGNGMQGVCPRRPVSCSGVAGRTAQPEAAMPESKLRARNGECRQLMMQVRVQQGCQARNNGFVMTLLWTRGAICGWRTAFGATHKRGEAARPIECPPDQEELAKKTMAVSEVGQMVANEGWGPERHPQDEETLLSFGLRLVTCPDGGVRGEGLSTRGCNASFIPNPSFGSAEAETGMFLKKFFERLVQGDDPVGFLEGRAA